VKKKNGLRSEPRVAVNNHWTGTLDWNTVMDYWIGLLELTTGINYWN